MTEGAGGRLQEPAELTGERAGNLPLWVAVRNLRDNF